MIETFDLPPIMSNLIAARDEIRRHYRSILDNSGSSVDLKFTLDGNLVGDLGEAIAVELFGIRLVETRAVAGIDGVTPDGKTTVQVKATGTERGPAFRRTETRADHLLFFEFDFEASKGTVVYNGPEHYAVSFLPNEFEGQRSLSRAQIRLANSRVDPEERMKPLTP